MYNDTKEYYVGYSNYVWLSSGLMSHNDLMTRKMATARPFLQLSIISTFCLLMTMLHKYSRALSSRKWRLQEDVPKIDSWLSISTHFLEASSQGETASLFSFCPIIKLFQESSLPCRKVNICHRQYADVFPALFSWHLRHFPYNETLNHMFVFLRVIIHSFPVIFQASPHSTGERFCVVFCKRR